MTDLSAYVAMTTGPLLAELVKFEPGATIKGTTGDSITVEVLGHELSVEFGLRTKYYRSWERKDPEHTAVASVKGANYFRSKKYPYRKAGNFNYEAIAEVIAAKARENVATAEREARRAVNEAEHSALIQRGKNTIGPYAVGPSANPGKAVRITHRIDGHFTAEDAARLFDFMTGWPRNA